MSAHPPIDLAALSPGDLVADYDHPPLTLVETVRWAGVQENSYDLHFDRDSARRQGASSFIASGGFRQALLLRAVTDWLGARGRVRRLQIRQTFPTAEGDTMHFEVHVEQLPEDPREAWIACSVTGSNQDGETILTGTCTVTLKE